MNLFEIAAREKYRFPYRGMISVEDLWDLSANQLDEIYRKLNAEQKRFDEDSLLAKKTKEQEKLSNQVALVKYIFEEKQAELAARKTEKVRAEKRQRILEILAEREDAALNNLSDADLKKMLDDLR